MPISDPKERAEKPRSDIEMSNRQSQKIYKDWREVDIHQFLAECYNGTGGFSGRTEPKYQGEIVSSYIIPNASENFYQTRVRMSAYTNYFKKYINAKFNPIFTSEIKCNVEVDKNIIDNHPYYDFMENITGGGVSAQDFKRAAIRESYIHDVCYVVMDKASDSINPFVYLRTPLDLEGYSTNEMGALISVMFYEGEEETPTGKIYKRRYIGVDEWRMEISDNRIDWRVDPESVVPNNMGIIPVYPMFSSRPEDLTDFKVCNPVNRDIAGMNCWLYDKQSKLDYLIDKQAHSILKIQGSIDSLPNGRDNALVIAESDKAIFEPGYISPDSSLPGVHSDRIEQQVKFMFDLMADSGVEAVAASPGQAESGVSKSFDFVATNDTLKLTVTILAQFDNWLVSTYKRFTGDGGVWDASCEYPTDFMPRASMGAQAYIDLYDFYVANNLYEAAQDTLLRLRALIDPMADKKEMQAILDEIQTIRAVD